MEATKEIEEWRPVKGYEGFCEVSSLARVRSLDRIVEQKLPYGRYGKLYRRGRILKQIMHHDGYFVVGLSKNGRTKLGRVNRIVAEAFIPNPDNLPIVNHKDECKTNNLPNNLEWCDVKYNNNYGTAKERAKKKLQKPIEQLTFSGQHVAFYESIKEGAIALNGDRNYICMTLRGKYTSAYGYLWRYAQ